MLVLLSTLVTTEAQQIINSNSKPLAEPENKYRSYDKDYFSDDNTEDNYDTEVEDKKKHEKNLTSLNVNISPDQTSTPNPINTGLKRTDNDVKKVKLELTKNEVNVR